MVRLIYKAWFYELKNKKQQQTQRTQRKTSVCFSVYGLQTENGTTTFFVDLKVSLP